MAVLIPDDIVRASRLSESELLQDLAVHFYERGILSLKRCADFAGLDRVQFHELLARRRIPLNYDENAVAADAQTLRRSGLL